VPSAKTSRVVRGFILFDSAEPNPSQKMDPRHNPSHNLSYFMGLRHALLTLQWGTPYNSLSIELFLKYLVPFLKT